MNGVHTAGSCTGALLCDDGLVGTDSGALSALDALVFINMGTAIGAV